MRIDDEGVGPFESNEFRLHGWREERGSATVSAVDVEPQGVLGGDVGHAGQVVHDAGVGRPRRGDDTDDVGTARILTQSGPEGGSGQAMVVRRDVQRADSEHVEGFADR